MPWPPCAFQADGNGSGGVSLIELEAMVASGALAEAVAQAGGLERKDAERAYEEIGVRGRVEGAGR